jgi:dihydrofolate reductase
MKFENTIDYREHQSVSTTDLDLLKGRADGRDVALGGGVSTIRQYLRAGLIDEMHLAISPLLLGSGEHLLAGIDTAQLGYRCTEHVPSQHVTHLVITKQGESVTGARAGRPPTT